MSQSTFSIRMDEDLKKQFDFLCSEFGMTASTSERGLDAFNALRASAKNNPAKELTLDEINAEISKARGEMQK